MMTDFIWTGNWPDAMEFMEIVGYVVPFGSYYPMALCNECELLHVVNPFAQKMFAAGIGERVRYYSSTKTFSVVG